MVRGNPILTSDNSNLKPWRQQVGQCALEARVKAVDCLAWKGIPVNVDVVFYLYRPKSAKKSDICPTRKPDIDKLGRAVLDALTGILFDDDSQVCDMRLTKAYGTPERTEITVDW
jgi:Holliday junction resolvase RusA-like endonuclease